jgi:hypothetical protein
MDTSEILFFVTQGHALWVFVHREMSKLQKPDVRFFAFG